MSRSVDSWHLLLSVRVQMGVGTRGPGRAGGPWTLTRRMVTGVAQGGCRAIHQVERAPSLHLWDTGTLQKAARAQVPTGPQPQAPRVSGREAHHEAEPPRAPGGEVRPTRPHPPRGVRAATGLGDAGSPASVIGGETSPPQGLGV